MNKIKTPEQIRNDKLKDDYKRIMRYGPLRYEENLEDALTGLNNKFEEYEAGTLPIEKIEPIIAKFNAMLPPKLILLKKEKVTAMTRAEQEAYALECAKYYTAFVTPYDRNTVRIERQSEHEGDWYLYSVVAKTYPGRKNDTYAVWTMNLSLGGLCEGYYDLDKLDINSVLNKKRH